MKELSFTELADLNAKETANDTDRELNEYMSSFLMPRLNELSGLLNEAGTGCEMTLDMTITPGLNVHVMDDYDVYATFLMDEDDEEKEILRLAAYRTVVGAEGDAPEEVSFVIHDERFWKDAGSFLFAARLFLSGATINTETLIGRPEKSGTPDGAELSDKTSVLLPRMNGLLDLLSEGTLVEEMGINGTEDPYIILAGDDFTAMVRYESTSEEDVYLLHLGTFIPFTKEEAPEGLEIYCRNFNNKYYSIRASIEDSAPEGFAMEDVDGYIAIHTCIPEYGELQDREFYERLLGELADAAAEADGFCHGQI